jgi:hypothetical protein
MKRLLVNACCGPCACNPIPFSGYHVDLFFCGDNFNSKAEYNKRYKALYTVYKKLYDTKLLSIDYKRKVFNSCEDCIRERLLETAEMAYVHEYDAFTTTLTISPHKNTELVNRIGREVGEQMCIPFLELDLKKNGGFEKSVRVSKELGIYRQRYCGCQNSMRQ